MNHLAFGPLLFALILAIAVTACRGPDKAAAPATATATEQVAAAAATSTPAAPAATRTATAIARTPTATRATSTPSAAGTASTGQARLNPDGLRQLRSYRYSLKMTVEGLSRDVSGKLTFDMNGEYVAPDRYHLTASALLGGLTLAEESIRIGNRSWIKQGNLWTEGVPNLSAKELTPTELFSSFKASDFQSLRGRQERLNNIATVRYTIDRASLEALSALSGIFGGTAAATPANLPESFVIDLWVAEDGGYPVRMTMKASGTQSGQRYTIDFDITIKDINDNTIRIEPPR